MEAPDLGALEAEIAGIVADAQAVVAETAYAQPSVLDTREMHEVEEKERSSDPALLRRYLREVSRHPRITPERERELGTLIQQGDRNALQALVNANLRFVVWYAKRYRGCGLPFIELIQEGNTGLIEAALRFDPTRMIKFITYAVWWVRQAMIHALSDQSGDVRLPQKQANLLFRIRKVRVELIDELERSPRMEEIADVLDVESDDVERLLLIQQEWLSLSAVIDEEHDFLLSDKLEQETFQAPIAPLLEESAREMVLGAVDTVLEAKEKRVITRRFGLDGKPPQTLKDIGKDMSLSRERIRQIEAQALEKLERSDRSGVLRSLIS